MVSITFHGRRLHFTLLHLSLIVAFSTVALSNVTSQAQTWQQVGEPGVGGRVTGLSVSPHDPNRILASGDMLGVGISNDGGDSWGETFGFRSWEMASATWHPTDPDIAWVGSMSGPYVSNDGGVNWQPQRNGFPPIAGFSFSAPIEEVLFDPNDVTRLLAFGGSSRRWRPNGGNLEYGAVWESTNSGSDWSRVSTLTSTGSALGDAPDGFNITSADFAAGSSTQLYAAVDSQGFYRSIDGGQNWAKSNSGLPHTNINRVAAHPTDADTVFLTLDSFEPSDNVFLTGGVYKSIDGGQNWAPVNNGLGQQVGSNINNTSRYHGLAISPTSPNTVYSGDYRFGNVHSVARTDDGGANWSSLLTANGADRFTEAGLNMEVIAVDPNNADRVFAAGSSAIIRSEDGGQSWEDITSDRVTEDGYVGNGFTGWVSTSLEFNPNDSSHIIAQAFDSARVMQTKDGGQSWTLEAQEPTPFGGGRDVVFAGTTIYASLGQGSVGFRGIARSTDSGDTWDVVSGNGLPEFSEPIVPNGVYASPTNPMRVWAAVDDELVASVDGGDNWTTAVATTEAGWLEEDPNTPDTFYFSSQNTVYRTTYGVDFQSIGGPGKPGKMAVDANGHLLLASHDGTGNAGNGVWRYDGATWSQILDNDYAVDVAVDPNDPLRIAVTTADPPFHDESRATGVYFSEDGGLNWSSINDGLPMLRGDTITFHPDNSNELWLGTAGRGFFRIRLDLTADFNGDGSIGLDDLTEWQDQFGTTTSGEDFLAWQRQYTTNATAPAARGVPEPASWTLILGLALTILAGQTRCHG